MRLVPPRSLTVPHPDRRTHPRSFGLARRLDALVDTATSSPKIVTVVADSSSHTKGAWVEVVASTPTEATRLTVGTDVPTSQSSTNTCTLLDVAVGGSGSETVVIADVPIGYNQVNSWVFPITIPAGTRIAFRTQSAVASKSLTMWATLGSQANGIRPASYTYTYTAVSATSTGVIINDSGSVNVKSGWVELVAATTERLGALVVCAQGGGDANMGLGNALIDIGIGGSGSETVLIPDLYYVTTSSEQLISADNTRPHPVDIPVGSRLSARVAFSSAANGAADVAVVGIPWRM